jgi:hypothetical protein
VETPSAGLTPSPCSGRPAEFVTVDVPLETFAPGDRPLRGPEPVTTVSSRLPHSLDGYEPERELAVTSVG